jgi:hypothetical protein
MSTFLFVALCEALCFRCVNGLPADPLFDDSSVFPCFGWIIAFWHLYLIPN